MIDLFYYPFSEMTYSAYQTIKRLTNKAVLQTGGFEKSRKCFDAPRVDNRTYSDCFRAKKRPYALVKPMAITSYRDVPKEIIQPSYVMTAAVKQETEINLKSKEDIELMRQAGQLARKVLNTTAEHVQVDTL